ncbi:hypothetical protein [Parvularcula oceani]|uniref:hypothetical protein n=1 Tax=Parvularcula oceani TaxID=1247963 RepID=UPI0012DFB37B|nr:hypothetical protein [Parvularcula oceani]
MNWTLGDYLFAAVSLGSAGAAFAFLFTRSGSMAYRLGCLIGVGTIFLLVWVNGAVGFIGSSATDANLMYAGVIAVAVGGACIARFRPLGMGRTMLAAAAAQVLVALIALAGGLGAGSPNWPLDVILGTALFTAFWLAAAWLFRRASGASLVPAAAPIG